MSNETRKRLALLTFAEKLKLLEKRATAAWLSRRPARKWIRRNLRSPLSSLTGRHRNRRPVHVAPRARDIALWRFPVALRESAAPALRRTREAAFPAQFSTPDPYSRRDEPSSGPGCSQELQADLFRSPWE